MTRETATKGGRQRKKAEGQKAKVQGKTKCISYIYIKPPTGGNRHKFEYTQWVELCRLNQTLFKSNKTGKAKNGGLGSDMEAELVGEGGLAD